MAIRTYDILLDSYNSTIPEPIVGRQGDKNGAVTLHVTITDRGAAVNLTGQTVNLIAETANGTAVVADNDGVTLTDAVNGKFDYAIPNALWSEAGKITKAYFSLNDTDGQQTTYDLIFIVKKAIDISQDEADDYITIIDGTIRDLKTKVDAIYTDYQSGNFYNKSETDNKDSATLSSANAYTDNSLKGISSVPETFANLAAIQSEYPNGSNGVMVAADNGHKYIWANSTWTDAGVYQAVGIATESVGDKHLAISARYGYIVSGAPVAIDSVAKTLTLSNAWYIIAGNEIISSSDSLSGNVSIELVTDDSNKTGFWITYSKDSKQFEVYESPDIPDGNVELGWISITDSVNYSLNAASVTVDESSQTFTQVQHDVYLVSKSPFKLDLTAKTLEIPDGYKTMIDGQNAFGISNSGTINLDTGTGVSFIFYDSINMEFAVVDSVLKASKAYFYLGYISWDTTPNINLKFRYAIDGYSTQTTAFNRNGYLAEGAPFIIDIDSKTLTVPQNYFATFITQYGIHDIRSANPDPIDLSNSTSASFLYINQTTLKITSSSSAGEQANDELYIGWISWTDITPSYDFDFPVVFAKTNLIKNDYGMEDGVAFGDSITWSYNTTKWCNIVKSRLRLATMEKNGIPGSTFAKDDSRTDSAVERVAEVKGDLIIVWFGINDFHSGRKLGIFGDGDQSTVFGAADYVFKTLITNNPTSKIIVMTPMKQHGYNQSPDSFTKNKQGLLQSDYVDAIKQVADYYSLPVLDMYTESGISAFVPEQATAYLRDGLHPNQAGEYRVANKIINFLNAH